MNQESFKSFSIQYSGITNVIATKVIILHPLQEHQSAPDDDAQVFECEAIWDTGATNSLITENV